MASDDPLEAAATVLADELRSVTAKRDALATEAGALRRALEGIRLNDRTHYEHHEPRPRDMAREDADRLRRVIDRAWPADAGGLTGGALTWRQPAGAARSIGWRVADRAARIPGDAVGCRVPRGAAMTSGGRTGEPGWASQSAGPGAQPVASVDGACLDLADGRCRRRGSPARKPATNVHWGTGGDDPPAQAVPPTGAVGRCACGWT